MPGAEEGEEVWRRPGAESGQRCVFVYARADRREKLLTFKTLQNTAVNISASCDTRAPQRDEYVLLLLQRLIFKAQMNHNLH